MSNFLVTGGAGFIGSHIAQRLVRDGHRVRILDDFSSGKTENIKPFADAIELFRGDIRDRDIVGRAVKGVECIFHQAALRSVPKSLEEPHEFNTVNIDGTLNLLEAAREYNVKRFVFASSSSIYGETDKFPQKETDASLLISPYALTKLAGEYYCRIFNATYGLETVSLRYFNVFGPRQALDDEYAVVVPKFITCILNDEQPPVYGTGKQSRDFTFIDNVVEANLLSATAERVGCEVVNVANGKDHSVLYLIDALNRILKKKIKPVFVPPRPGDVFRTCADITRVKRLLRYNPQITFEEGLRLTVQWFEKNRQS